jgi:hypothetical protein
VKNVIYNRLIHNEESLRNRLQEAFGTITPEMARASKLSLLLILSSFNSSNKKFVLIVAGYTITTFIKFVDIILNLNFLTVQ